MARLNKYRRWHDQIIKRAKTRELTNKYESHHIVPRSLGGSNEKSNKVRLTYREHFLIHWILTKITTGNDKKKMFLALSRMRGSKQHAHSKSWQYAVMAESNCLGMIGNKHLLGHKHSEKTLAKLSASHMGRKLHPHEIEILRARMTGNTYGLGRKHKPESIEKMRLIKTGKRLSKKTRAKIARARRGTKASLATRQKMSASHKRRRRTA